MGCGLWTAWWAFGKHVLTGELFSIFGNWPGPRGAGPPGSAGPQDVRAPEYRKWKEWLIRPCPGMEEESPQEPRKMLMPGLRLRLVSIVCVSFLLARSQESARWSASTVCFEPARLTAPQFQSLGRGCWLAQLTPVSQPSVNLARVWNVPLQLSLAGGRRVPRVAETSPLRKSPGHRSQGLTLAWIPTSPPYPAILQGGQVGGEKQMDTFLKNHR